MTNLQKAKTLEADYLKQIQKLIKEAGSQNQLSIFLYGNENTLQSKLSRAKNSTPWKLMTYCQILLDYDLVKKKGARECRITSRVSDALLRVLDTKLLGDVHTTKRKSWGNLIVAESKRFDKWE